MSRFLISTMSWIWSRIAGNNSPAASHFFSFLFVFVCYGYVFIPSFPSPPPHHFLSPRTWTCLRQGHTVEWMDGCLRQKKRTLERDSIPNHARPKNSFPHGKTKWKCLVSGVLLPNPNPSFPPNLFLVWHLQERETATETFFFCRILTFSSSKEHPFLSVVKNKNGTCVLCLPHNLPFLVKCRACFFGMCGSTCRKSRRTERNWERERKSEEKVCVSMCV